MPTLYLISLSCILSPITFILMSQIIQFIYYRQKIETIKRQNQESMIYNKSYNVAQIYIKNHFWNKAIIILDNLIYHTPNIQTDQIAVYYNMIGIILQQNKYLQTSQKYYETSCKMEPEYEYAIKNLQSLLSIIK
uniref:Photosystem I assembly protein Ycf37 n=1 Tax=Hommersandiophycus borowitzkae TaxID=268573 RepID=A0A1G4NU06_9FLOR|nr:Hypothetical protein ycf37 [Hommersandiophycus borowitzkae]SCW22094.1 Hypothetical protein ycf37 [Hommersandiophycus borowitzkae]